MLTDGRQTGNRYDLVRAAADDPRRQGVYIIAVTVGSCSSNACKVKHF